MSTTLAVVPVSIPEESTDRKMDGATCSRRAHSSWTWLSLVLVNMFFTTTATGQGKPRTNTRASSPHVQQVASLEAGFELVKIRDPVKHCLIIPDSSSKEYHCVFPAQNTNVKDVVVGPLLKSDMAFLSTLSMSATECT